MWIGKTNRRGEAPSGLRTAQAGECFTPATKSIAPFAGAVLILFLTACQVQVAASALPTLSWTAPGSVTPSPADAPSITPITSPPTVTATLSPVPTVTPHPTSTPLAMLTVIADGLGSPDDLALMPDGSVLFSDETSGTIRRVLTSGQASRPPSGVATLVGGLQAPEGIVILPDGSLLIAEQGRNRIVHLQPGHPVTTWLTLNNSQGGLGVDGIARDPATGDIIVPDSPNGRVLRVDAQGKNERIIASGLTRPTGAAVALDGAVLIADESGDHVYRVLPDGRTESLGRFAMPDDVVADSHGNIFVTSLADNSVRRIDAQARTTTLIATVLGPQGLVIEPDGNLIVSEPARHRLLRLRP